MKLHVTSLAGTCAAIGALLMFSAASALAGPTLVVPPSLSPGDHYRIAFVTSTLLGANSPNIAYYDNIVTAAANGAGSQLSGLGTTWQAIVSTSSVSAYDHIGGNFSQPVFLLNGLLVANNALDLWDASIHTPISLTEAGNTFCCNVWTGTINTGAISSFPLGLTGFVPGLVGAANSTGTGWIASSSIAPNTSYLPFYGISGILTVPGASPVPEPASVGLTFAGLVLGLAARRHCRAPKF